MMHVDYLAAGNVMLDKVRFLDGSQSGRENIGGPATFGYSGIRLWTDSVLQCSNVGQDYEELFIPWMSRNQVIRDGFKVVCERSNHHIMHFKDQSGTYAGPFEYEENEADKWLENDAWQDFGYMKTKPEEIEVFTRGGKVKGLYFAQNADRIFWEKMRAIRQRDGFKIMWEIEAPWSWPRYLDTIIQICRDSVDAFSINIAEAQNLFGCEGDQACIQGLRQLDVDLTLFRVGGRGLYVVTKEEAILLPPTPGPVIDPTGCGNTSTGAALYAYANGKDPLMVGIMANVASSQNIRQFGIIPDFGAVREDAFAMAKTLYEQYKLQR